MLKAKRIFRKKKVWRYCYWTGYNYYVLRPSSWPSQQALRPVPPPSLPKVKVEGRMGRGEADVPACYAGHSTSLGRLSCSLIASPYIRDTAVVRFFLKLR